MKRVKIVFGTNHEALEEQILQVSRQHNLTSIRTYLGPNGLGLYAECQWDHREIQTDEDRTNINSLVEYALDATNDMLQAHRNGIINATEVINAYERHIQAIDQLALAGLYEWEPEEREQIIDTIQTLKREGE